MVVINLVCSLGKNIHSILVPDLFISIKFPFLPARVAVERDQVAGRGMVTPAAVGGGRAHKRPGPTDQVEMTPTDGKKPREDGPAQVIKAFK